MKKLLSLFLSILMLVNLVPTTLAATETTPLTATTNLLNFTRYYAGDFDYTNKINSPEITNAGSEYSEMPVLSAVGDVTTGDTLYGTADVANTKNGADAVAFLTDGYYFMRAETEMAKTTGTNEAENYAENVTKNMAPELNTAKMVKFAENTGVDLTWTTTQDVARLHVWAWPANVINGYEVYVKEGNDWGSSPVATGSMADFEPGTANEYSTF